MKSREGSQNSMPAIRTIVKGTATSPVRVKQVLIVAALFSADGRKRTRAGPRPRRASVARNEIVRFLPSAENKAARSEEHTSELQSLAYLVCRLLLEKKKN